MAGESTLKILALDIEASNLSADFGIVLTFGSKVVGEGKVEVLNILDYTDKGGDLIKAEKGLLKDVTKRMLDADVWLGHYAVYYDIPFLNTRLLYHGLPVLPANHPLIDTWRVSRNRLKLRNNRLATISDFMKTEDEKNAIKPEQWIRALGGHKKSMDYIVEHNRRDIVVLEEVYLRLRPLVLDHPNMTLPDGRGECRNCGSDKLQRRGRHTTKQSQYWKYQCQDCASWQRGSKPIARAKTRLE